MIAVITERTLARKVPMPLKTLQRRIRERGIEPCAVTVSERPSVHLYNVARLPELRRLLRTEPKEFVL